LEKKSTRGQLLVVLVNVTIKLLQKTSSRCTKKKGPLGESIFRKGKIVVTLYYFLGLPCLNFIHIIIMEDFHNVFAYHGRLKPKTSNVKKTTFKKKSLKYVCAKNI
jgi:hypothetical protein